MLVVISPAKTLDFCPQKLTRKNSSPEFLDDSSELVSKLRGMSRARLADLMSISPQLGELNYDRYRAWKRPFTPKNAKQSLLAFKGDVYTGFRLEDYSAADFDFAQKHLRILSGLYGLLKPLDLIQPYRLEMGTRLHTKRGKDLYAFWGTKITEAINRALKQQKVRVLVNLASNEYFNSIRDDKLDASVVSPVFKDLKNGNYKIVSFFAKRARGEMANFIIKKRIRKAADLPKFKAAGYRFDPESSTETKPVFLRDEPV